MKKIFFYIIILFIFLNIQSNSAIAAIAYDTYSLSGAWSGSQSSVTWSHTCSGSDRVLIVFITTYSKNVSSVTYNGSGMTQITSQVTDFGTIKLWAYYLINPSSGANNVVVTLSGNDYVRTGAISLNGTNQTTQPDVYNSSRTKSSPVTATVTNTQNAFLVMVEYNPDDCLTAGTNTTYIGCQGAELSLARGTNSVTSGSNSLNYSFAGGRTSTYILIGVKEGISTATTNEVYIIDFNL